ncbi:MFS transporter [Haloechinothrix salitolerans]|uniref:MFS transporter n=1 Tax=Haloechinothrix salitolerans TaxID=926830 RepID=A0ABW2BZP0_9PSEU
MDSGDEPRGNRWWLVFAAGAAVFMAQFDVTVVNVALPTIERDFGTSTSVTEWVILGYVLPLIALTLPSGRWLEGIGRRAAMVFAVGGFATASVAVGLAGDISWLIAARATQGAFGAVLFALVPVLATIAVPPENRGKAMAIVMTLGPLGGVSGPALGGVLIDTIGWSWIFYVNVPVAALILIAAVTQLPRGTRVHLPGRAWLTETGVLGAATVALLLSLSLTAEHGIAWLALAPAAVPFLLVWRQLPSSEPVKELLRAPGMSGPHFALLLEMAAVLAVQFLLPFHLHRTGATPTEVGLILLAFPAGVMLFGILGGVLTDRWNGRSIATIGAVTVVLGLLLTMPLDPEWAAADLAWRLGVAGAGAGLFAGPNQTVAMNTAPQHLLNTTGATTSVARQLGIALGPALVTASWALSGDDAMRWSVGLAAVLAMLSALALVRRTPRRTKTELEPTTERTSA